MVSRSQIKSSQLHVRLSLCSLSQLSFKSLSSWSSRGDLFTGLTAVSLSPTLNQWGRDWL